MRILRMGSLSLGHMGEKDKALIEILSPIGPMGNFLNHSSRTNVIFN
jgi:hypothetical protein